MQDSIELMSEDEKEEKKEEEDEYEVVSRLEDVKLDLPEVG